MKYNLESTLPINAFSPRGGRGPFSYGMTLEGGGGGGGGVVGKAFGSAAKAVTQAVQGVVQPVYNATFKQIPGVDKALVGLDKTVGNSIPGGWGTVASVASSFIPVGSPLLMGLSKAQLATGLGALAGSGVMKKGHEFNLQGAIMGGAMAYGASQISQGLQEAGGGSAAQAAERAAASDTARIAASSGVEGAATGANSQAAMLANQTSGFADAVPRGFADAIPKDAALQAANTGLSNLASNPDVFSGLAGTQPIVPQPTMLESLGSNLADAGSGALSNMGDAARGVQNLSGFGTGMGEAATKFANPITPMGLGSMVLGGSGLMALEEQKKYLQESLAAGKIAQDEYDAAMASIEEQVKVGREAVAQNPFNPGNTTSGSLSGSGEDSPASYETAYTPVQSASERLYAYGGIVNPPDDQTNMPSQSPLADGFGLGNLYGAMQPQPQANQNAGYSQSFYPDNYNNGVTGYAGGGEVPRFGFGGMFGPVSASASGEAGSMPTSGGGGMFGGILSKIAAPLIIKAVGQAPNSDAANIAAGEKAVRDNPFNPGSTDSSPTVSIGIQGLNRGSPTDLLYAQKRAKLNYELPEYAAGGYAMGGEPRFLSGGGDGMSDSIKANIGGTQEARLADGEFVIPADVVSHLGNGSSKAGAKQLYTMMDRVRKVRTGTKKQGKQINPRKYMAA
jgi:hypothetical protein